MLPSARSGTSLVGAQVHPSMSCVPPTDVTDGLESGYERTGCVATGEFRCPCLRYSVLPVSPDAASTESPFAAAAWYCASHDASCEPVAPLSVSSLTPKLCEMTVPAGSFCTTQPTALMRLETPCEPSAAPDEAGGIATITMCASGAIA